MSDHKGVGTFMLVLATLYSISAAAAIYLIMRVSLHPYAVLLTL